MNSPCGITIRSDIRPGDIGSIIKLHGEYYSRHNGYDATFEPYVAVPLSEFVLRKSGDENLWMVLCGEDIHGCIAIVDCGGGTSQLRWYLLDEQVQGLGLGRQLMELALGFARDRKYKRIILWTVDEQRKAIAVYEKNGFRCIESVRHEHLWGKAITELCYEKLLDQEA